MKKLYTVADIESMAGRGQMMLILDAHDIITPLARDRARELGVQLRSGSTDAPSPPSSPTPTPAVAATPGLTTDALTAFIGLLKQARETSADTPQLARRFDDLLLAVEQGQTIHLQAAVQPASLPADRRDALAGMIGKLTVLGRYLFGPDSPHRRFDILWALTELSSFRNR